MHIRLYLSAMGRDNSLYFNKAVLQVIGLLMLFVATTLSDAFSKFSGVVRHMHQGVFEHS